MKKNNKKLEKKIMEKIENNEVKMKPKWYFVGRWLSLNAITWGLLVFGSGILVWMLWQIELMEPGEVLQFGKLGQEVLLEEFPYGILAAALAVGAGGYVFFRNLGENYKKSKGKVLWLVIIVVILSTLGLWLLKGVGELELGLWLM